MKIKIIYEDNDIVVIYKPAGFPSQSGKVGQADCVSELKNYFKGGYVGLVHRLDQPVEGLLVFAKTKQAAGNLSTQLAKRVIHKCYLGAVDGIILKEGKLQDYLIKNSRTNLAEIVSLDAEGAKQAKLSYRVFGADEDKGISILRIELETGRFHQIRCQLAGMGAPLLGDSKYGTVVSNEKSRRLGIRNVALCASTISFRHPVKKQEMEFSCEPAHEILREFLHG